MEKYGARVTFKCTNCKHEVDYPLHQKDDPPLEKYASYCTHEWEEVDPEEIQYATSSQDES